MTPIQIPGTDPLNAGAHVDAAWGTADHPERRLGRCHQMYLTFGKRGLSHTPSEGEWTPSLGEDMAQKPVPSRPTAGAAATQLCEVTRRGRKSQQLGPKGQEVWRRSHSKFYSQESKGMRSLPGGTGDRSLPMNTAELRGPRECEQRSGLGLC